MVKAFFAAAAVVLLAGAAAAEPSAFRFFGSAGGEAQWQMPRDSSPLNPGNFLDLRRNTDAVYAVGFADLALPGRIGKLHAKLRTSSVWAGDSTTKLSVGELFWQHSFSPAVDLTVGRKIEKWGTGYAWNPTGFVNPRKDPSDPNDRLSSYRGLDMVELGLFIDDWTISLLALPDVDWDGPHASIDRTAWAARAYRLILNTDVSFVARGGPGVRSEGFSLARIFGDALELHAEAAWNQNGTRTVPDGATLATRHSDTAQYLLGGQYTLSHDVNLVVEYFHDGNGYTAAEWNDFRAAADTAGQLLATGDPRALLALNRAYGASSVGRDYAFQRLSAPLLDNRIALEAIAIENLRDTSGVFRLTAIWKLRPNVQLYAVQTELWGGRSSEFHYLQVQRLTFAGLKLFF